MGSTEGFQEMHVQYARHAALYQMTKLFGRNTSAATTKFFHLTSDGAALAERPVLSEASGRAEGSEAKQCLVLLQISHFTYGEGPRYI